MTINNYFSFRSTHPTIKNNIVKKNLTFRYKVNIPKTDPDDLAETYKKANEVAKESSKNNLNTSIFLVY